MEHLARLTDGFSCSDMTQLWCAAAKPLRSCCLPALQAPTPTLHRSVNVSTVTCKDLLAERDGPARSKEAAIQPLREMRPERLELVSATKVRAAQASPLAATALRASNRA